MTPQRHLQTRVWPKLGSPMPYSLTSTCLNIIPRSPKLTQAHPSSPKLTKLTAACLISPKLTQARWLIVCTFAAGAATGTAGAAR
jgi:hypothetical protein